MTGKGEVRQNPDKRGQVCSRVLSSVDIHDIATDFKNWRESFNKLFSV